MERKAENKQLKQNRILTLIKDERRRQDLKFGVQSHSKEVWLSIITEELGEVAQEINEIRFDNKNTINYEAELVQVAAACIAALEDL